ncbi:response regulator [Geomonas subterranea]|uniref:Response regulator n=1 Tax=Geomonas subterranea TaxID=2847989 RepID=A0ABX8LLM9_9BACT|nr:MULTISPECIES: response regulator [Geomonas]QXE92582.1 response regulator [Geomonas subterranea]QXM09320.1 response regulator [Geomonas subterranea]
MGNENQRPAKVLVMDDDEMVRFVAGETLKRYGFEVEFANDGAQAVEIYRERHEAGEGFAAVILDLNIPGGMGGQEAMKRLLEIDPAAKGYVSSGRTDDPVMMNHQTFGFSGTIEKPYFYLNKQLMEEFSKTLRGTE